MPEKPGNQHINTRDGIWWPTEHPGRRFGHRGPRMGSLWANMILEGDVRKNKRVRKWDTETGTEAGALVAPGRCTRPSARTAATNARYRSSPPRAGRYTAGIASRSIALRESSEQTTKLDDGPIWGSFVLSCGPGFSGLYFFLRSTKNRHASSTMHIRTSLRSVLSGPEDQALAWSSSPHFPHSHF